MRTLNWAIVIVGILCFSLSLSNFVMPEFILGISVVFLNIAQVLLLAIALCLGFIRWRKVSRMWLVPSLVCLGFILSIYFATFLGDFISDRIFGMHLAEYSRVVDDFKNGNLACHTPCDAERALIEVKSRPAHIRSIWGVHCDDGGVIVMFLVDTDVPLLHEGYLFKDYGGSSNCKTGHFMPEKQWSVWHIKNQWYHFSD